MCVWGGGGGGGIEGRCVACSAEVRVALVIQVMKFEIEGLIEV